MANTLAEITLMTIFWMVPDSVDPTCGLKGTLQKILYHSKQYVSTKKYFNGEQTFNGEATTVGEWDLLYDKAPCDISTTPFTALVSERFKTLTESLDINVIFHQVNVLVSGEATSDAYYFPELLDVENFMDPSSNNHIYPGWIRHSPLQTKVHIDNVGPKNWVKQEKAFGYARVVSEHFKNTIRQNELTNFMFIEAKAADKN